MLHINHGPPPFQILYQTRPGSSWRLKGSNWLVINTAGLVSKIVSRLKLGFLHPPSPPYPRAGPPRSPRSSGTWLWGEWVCRATPRQLQVGCQAASPSFESKKEKLEGILGWNESCNCNASETGWGNQISAIAEYSHCLKSTHPLGL